MVSRGQYDGFIAYLEEQYANYSIYVWGAQGQGYPTVNESWIKSKESGTHETNALKTYAKAVDAGYEQKLRAFDCSGLGMYYLQNLQKIYSYDMSSNSMMAKCVLISKSELAKGDWVFRTYTSGSNKGKAYHIGYIVDDDLNVIEAKGRAYGVVKGAFSSSYWNAYARPDIFKDYIEGSQEDVLFNGFDRVLSYGSKGTDVEELQRLLNVAGADPVLDEDGIFGSKTLAAVKEFQSFAQITVDGVAGQETITMLERYSDDLYDGEQVTVFTRLLKKGVEGEDVAELQRLLNIKGAYPALDVDGIFGSRTYAAVKAFQLASGCDVDGIVGKETSAALGVEWKG